MLLRFQTPIVFGFQKVDEGWVALGHDFDLIAALPFVLEYFSLYQLLLFRLLLIAAMTSAIAFAAHTALNPQTLEKRQLVWRRDRRC